MKTNFKNIAAVSTVVFAGVFSANATENNSGLFTSAESTTVDYRTEAQLVTRWFADMAEAKATQMVMERSWATATEAAASLENEAENTFETADFAAEAQLMTRETADREEARATQKVMERGWVAPTETSSSIENTIEFNDFQKEAQLMTREIADREEAIATQKVMEKGWVEYQENFDESDDFRTEAQLMTRLAADKEEVRAIQKLVSEGKIAETK